MESSLLLRKTVASFFDVDESRVNSDFSLRSRSDSVSRATLDAAIRKVVGRVSKVVYTASTVGEIEAELFGQDAVAGSDLKAGDSHSNVTRLSLATPGAGSLVCGVDLEVAENLPETLDYWEEPFYQQTFTPGEIAYCVRRDQPRIHFAARWAAKEAIKKCEPSLIASEMNQIEVVMGPHGSPQLALNHAGVSTPLPHALSLSHTGSLAIATVVHGLPPAIPLVLQAPSAPDLSMSQPTIPITASLSRNNIRLGLFLNIITLILAAYALYRTMR